MRIRIIDAFTQEAFRGNQAGVCVLPAGDWPEEGWMQRVAAELNCAETAFTRPAGERWELRWFTPATEVAMCGHATLATAHALHEDGLADEVRFATLSGELRTAVGPDGLITMDFPVSPPTPGQKTRETKSWPEPGSAGAVTMTHRVPSSARPVRSGRNSRTAVADGSSTSRSPRSPVS